MNSQVVVQEQVVSLITEGVFDQFPRLHVALLECGFTWLPSLLMRFERDWKSLWREVPWMKREPTHYVYENMRASTEPAQLPSDPGLARRILDLVRPGDFLMYASDFPHDHGPGAATLLAALTEEETAAVLHRNAREFYRLDS
jgi:predicted TIM-barrel fold metal-dependent hydrolase